MKKLVYLGVLAGVSSASAGSYEDFFRAIKRDDGATVQELLQRGFDPNTVDPEGRGGLLIALQEPSLKAADALMQHPQVDVNRLNAVGESPLMMAALKGQLDWCKRLIERGADINKTGWTPLHYAATSGNMPIIELLLEHHAFIDAESPNGTTPLMMAARYGSEDSARQLMAAGADPTMRNERELNAADFARSVNREQLAQALEGYAREYAARNGSAGKR
ncbi:ankyrin repeat domain-containing protein [Schlegelella sp. S2-27]|uniref:Ankyrin repeat domain-containing protein n=1 Tax=Caldimonas mangrovi TaxID=2944811 RepID=A0ABT0YR82_9BURK|nr:ankyrin repeat domain-containing protein [Caldimonas mangrovi]MCM5681237.1 ankyrin repeat domain-containing protein [Caldimonas mangrovi]